MTNENQKQLLKEIKDSVFDVHNRMTKIIELLSMLVEDNTIEKDAKNDFIKTMRESQEQQQRGGGRHGMGGKGGTGGIGGTGGSGKPGTKGKPGGKGGPGGTGGSGGEGGNGGHG